MEYREHALPKALAGWVAAVWDMRCGGSADATVEHIAPPDGCIELIRRTRGHSRWRTPQPVLFVTGLGTAPARLALSGDAEFIGVRLWPWAWNRLGDVPCPALFDRWQPVGGGYAAHLAALNTDETTTRLSDRFAHVEPPAIGRALLAEQSVQAVAAAAGVGVRTLQRWCTAEIGISPRRYLRLLRFARAMHGIQADADALALHAAESGFADQPHMAREFRALSGRKPSRARREASGPFLPDR
jgi:AraC-like DNA-binding protein